METTLQGAKVWSSELNEFISQDHIILAGALQDYDRRFTLAYCPARSQGAFGQTKPFQIQERRNDGSVVPIRDLTLAEMQNPAAVLAWVAKGDLAKRGVMTVFQEMEVERMAAEAFEIRTREEERLDAREMMEALASGGRNHKHFYRHGGKTFRR